MQRQSHIDARKVAGGFAAFQCGKALPYREHSKLDRGYAARYAVAAMPHRNGCTQSPGLRPQYLQSRLWGIAPQIIERYLEGQSPSAHRAAQPRNQIEQYR